MSYLSLLQYKTTVSTPSGGGSGSGGGGSGSGGGGGTNVDWLSDLHAELLTYPSEPTQSSPNVVNVSNETEWNNAIAYSNASPGDIINITNDFELSGSSLDKEPIGTAVNPIIVRGNGYTIKVADSKGVASTSPWWFRSAEHLYLIDITFDCNNGRAIKGPNFGLIYNGQTGGVPVGTGIKNVHLWGCRVTGSWEQVTKWGDNSTDCSIIGCHFYDNITRVYDPGSASFGGSGVYLGNAGNLNDKALRFLIERNLFENSGDEPTDKYGHVVNVKMGAGNVTVRRNIIRNWANVTQALIVFYDGNTPLYGSIRHLGDHLIEENLIYDSPESSVSGASSKAAIHMCQSGTVRRNVMWDIPGGIQFGRNFNGPSNAVTVENNTIAHQRTREDITTPANYDTAGQSGPYTDPAITRSGNITLDSTGEYDAALADFVGPTTGSADTGSGAGSGWQLAALSAIPESAGALGKNGDWFTRPTYATNETYTNTGVDRFYVSNRTELNAVLGNNRTIMLADGDYQGGASLHLDGYTNMELISENHLGAKFEWGVGGGAAKEDNSMFVANTSNLVIRGIDFKHAKYQGIYFGAKYYGTNGPNYNPLVEWCRFDDAGQSHIKVDNGSTGNTISSPTTNVVIRYCDFTKWAQGHSSQIYPDFNECIYVGDGTWPTDNRVLGITIEKCTFDAIDNIYGGETIDIKAHCEDITVTACSIMNTHMSQASVGGALAVCGDAGLTPNAGTVLVSKCVIMGTRSYNVSTPNKMSAIFMGCQGTVQDVILSGNAGSAFLQKQNGGAGVGNAAEDDITINRVTSYDNNLGFLSQEEGSGITAYLTVSNSVSDSGFTYDGSGDVRLIDDGNNHTAVGSDYSTNPPTTTDPVAAINEYVLASSSAVPNSAGARGKQ